MPGIKVVFFDAGGTLFRPYPSVGEIYARVARKHGVSLEAGKLEELFHEAWHARNGRASLAGASSEKIERDWWRALVSEVFSPMATFNDFEAFFHELYDYFAGPECWRLFDDTVPVLEELSRKPIHLGIISNWDHRLFSIIQGLGLRPYFKEIIASAAVGVAKPGPGIYQRALDAVGVEAACCLHVGDSLEEDYYGARQAGLQAVLLDRHRRAYNGPTTSFSGFRLLSNRNLPTSGRQKVVAGGLAKKRWWDGVVRIETLRDLLPLLT